jgi:glycosyltransferase involved in cell wall biosynthesis
MSDAKLIWSRRDMGILRTGKHHAAYRLMAGAPDAVFAVSEQVRRHTIEVDGVAAERVVTVHNGLDLKDWSGVGRAGRAEAGDGVRITTVGNIRRVKGHDVLVRAAAAIVERFPSARFSVAGDVLEADYFAELQALVRELGLTGRFEFVGGVARLDEHLSGADVFVLPSRSEGFSNAIVEAMAAGLPVVATDVGGNAEAVRAGVTGYLVPSEDVGALTEAMAKLLAEPLRARAMGEAGRVAAAENFTTEAMMGKIAGVYARVLGS